MSSLAALLRRLFVPAIVAWTFIVVFVFASAPSPGHPLTQGCDAIYMPADWYASCRAAGRESDRQANQLIDDKQWREVKLPLVLGATAGYLLIAVVAFGVPARSSRRGNAE